jgi:hypothetical protein
MLSKVLALIILIKKLSKESYLEKPLMLQTGWLGSFCNTQIEIVGRQVILDPWQVFAGSRWMREAVAVGPWPLTISIADNLTVGQNP